MAVVVFSFVGVAGVVDVPGLVIVRTSPTVVFAWVPAPGAVGVPHACLYVASACWHEPATSIVYGVS